MGLFGLFKKKVVLEPKDLSILKVDLHSHLIPGIDDGSPDLQTSLDLIEQFMSLGYKKIITTPHIMIDFYKNTPEIINKGLEDIRNAIAVKQWNIEIDAAAEYYTDEYFLKMIEEKNVLTFGDNYVLFELSFMQESPHFSEAIFQMQLGGYRPVLAHVERYPYWYNDYSKYKDLKDRGVLLQLNINSLSGAYSPATKKAAEHIIDEGLFDFIGSDCHHMQHLQMIDKARSLPYLHKVLDSGKLKNAELL
ncbi:MAG: histidinol phosphatase [Flavobacteriales bacterium]|nr:histidinol phosphatase [Flavobacteriales bacterium]